MRAHIGVVCSCVYMCLGAIFRMIFNFNNVMSKNRENQFNRYGHVDQNN